MGSQQRKGRYMSRRAMLLLLLIFLAGVVFWPVPGSAEEPPPAPQVNPFSSANYHADVWIHGQGQAGATITVERTSTGEALPCNNAPVVVAVSFWECYVSGSLLHSTDKANETSEQVTAYQTTPGGGRSAGAPATVTYIASRFSISTPPQLPAGDAIVLEGVREDTVVTTVEWTVKHKGASLFGTRLCDVGEQGENQDFVCTYDSNNPNPPDPRDDDPAAPAYTAIFVAPAIHVSPAALQEGAYTATFTELLNDVPIDSISFNFAVGTAPASPPPGAPPGTGSEVASGTTVETIPLAPLPTLDETEAIPDGPAPADPETPSAAPPTSPVDDDVLRILILAVIAFTVMAMSGARGMGWPRRLIEAPVGASGSTGQHVAEPMTRDATVAVIAGLGAGGLDGTDEDAGRARPFGNAWGDRSVTWRFPGWSLGDKLSQGAPVALAPRFPLFARIAADGSYVRAALGVLWALFPAAGLILGAAAALSGGAAPLPPALGLVAGLLVLAVLDASAGIAAVTAFTVIMLARGGLTAEGLSLAEGVRGLMGLAALWFVAPLVAAAARPLRRVAEPEHIYPWDRLGDTIIAALISGWAVQGIVGALGDLTGRDLAITSHADGFALLTIGAVIGRFLLEEATALLYPRRLQAVQKVDELPAPTYLQQVRALIFRAALLAFFAGAFLGSCWQLWLGVAIFSIPQMLQLLGDRIPDIKPLASAVPRGVVQILVLVTLGTAIAYLVDSRGSDDQLTAIRQGFVLLAIPGAALEMLSVVGGETPKIRWTWPKQLAGAAVVAVTAGLVLFLL